MTLCDYTDARIVSSDNKFNSCDYHTIVKDYRRVFREGFDDEHLLGEDYDDYMYEADTSDATKKVMAYYSPYFQFIMENIPEKERMDFVMKDFQYCDTALKIEQKWKDEHYRRILKDTELCIMSVVGLAINYQKETENVTWGNIYKFIVTTCKELLEDDSYPGLTEFPKSIRQEWFLVAFTVRANYLVRGIVLTEQ